MFELALEAPALQSSISVLLDILPVDVPALLCLDVLDAESLYAHNITDRIFHFIVTSKSGTSPKYHEALYIQLFDSLVTLMLSCAPQIEYSTLYGNWRNLIYSSVILCGHVLHPAHDLWIKSRRLADSQSTGEHSG